MWPVAIVTTCIGLYKYLINHAHNSDLLHIKQCHMYYREISISMHVYEYNII